MLTGFFQLHDMFAWQPIRVSRVTNPNWLPCKRIVELEETVSIHNHAKGDAGRNDAFELASGQKEPLKKKRKKRKKKTRALHCFFFFFLFFFSAALLDRFASWNATDVIVASGNPFAWLWMLTVSFNSTICLHGSQLGFVTLLTLIGCHANIS